MATIHASVITAVTLRVAGQVPTDITVRHIGTPRVAEAWTQARTVTSALPYVAGASRLHLPARVGLVGVIMRLGGEPFCTAAWIPGRPGVAHPPHVRAEIGPVTFEVCDQAAWHSIGHA